MFELIQIYYTYKYHSNPLSKPHSHVVAKAHDIPLLLKFIVPICMVFFSEPIYLNVGKRNSEKINAVKKDQGKSEGMPYG